MRLPCTGQDRILQGKIRPPSGNDKSSRAPAPEPLSQSTRACNVPKAFRWFSIGKLISQPLEERFIYPRQYFAASNETFFLTLVLTWALTLAFHPEQIFEHPARRFIGSLNPCMAWDYPPASYIAIVMCSANVYFCWRYAFLEHMRTRLLNPGALSAVEKFASASAALLACASNFWLLLWVIGPGDGNWKLHTGIFVFYLSASYLACLGNYLESKNGKYSHVVQKKHTVFIVTYGLATLFLPTVYFYDIFTYTPGQEPSLPAPIKITREVVAFSEDPNADPTLLL